MEQLIWARIGSMIQTKQQDKKLSTVVVKRRGHTEDFDEKKIYGSIYAACSTCDLKHLECEKLAEQTLVELKQTIKGRKEVNSSELFGLVISILAKYHEDAAVMYQLHRDIS